MRLSRSMTLAGLMKMGFVEIHIAKPGAPLRHGEWRDASPNIQSEPRPGDALTKQSKQENTK